MSIVFLLLSIFFMNKHQDTKTKDTNQALLPPNTSQIP